MNRINAYNDHIKRQICSLDKKWHIKRGTSIHLSNASI